MHEKDIKRTVKNQLKKKFPSWNRMSKKQKKELAARVLAEVLSEHDFDRAVETPLNELTGVPSAPEGVISLGEMGRFIAGVKGEFLDIKRARSQKRIKDRELKAIDALLDDRVIDRLLAYDGYTPSKRIIYPHNLLRAELLKCIKYPELSYRKFCGEIINNLEKKTERAFVHLPLHKKLVIDHSRLSQFRSSLTFSQQLNLYVYMVHLLVDSGLIEHPFSICGVDSTELPINYNHSLLCTVLAGNKKVRIYSDLDADCGVRRKKRDKSNYFIGYRAHTVTAIDPKTGRNFPLFSLIAPGNHHDSLFVGQLLSISRAMGLDTSIITADTAYADAGRNLEIQNEFDISVVTPPDKNVKVPDNVDPERGFVYMDEFCETAMGFMGRADSGHEFKCGADDCPRSRLCPQYRVVPFDSGFFGRIPDQVAGIEKVRDLRKHIERAYNLLKHRDGLDPLRVRSQQGVMCQTTFANMTTLLLEIVGSRKLERREAARQLEFDLACGA